MTNKRDVDIFVDNSSWTNNVPPTEISSLVGRRATDIDSALLHTAIWTRPPTYMGFNLSDYWAWIRYARAIAQTNDLRLRSEWKDIDSHQKTVLSDDLGVGFTTQLLLEELGFLSYVDTRFFVNVLNPGILSLARSQKLGPSKSPDFIALDSNLKFNVLECKGTQDSPEKPADAVQKGTVQKRNLSAPSHLKYSLVAGLFIPQWDNFESARTQISDPQWQYLLPIFTEIPQRERLVAMIQISLAKHFALMGLYSVANSLSTTATSKLRSLEDTRIQDMGNLLREDKERGLIFSIENPLPPLSTQEVRTHDSRLNARRVRFQVRCPVELYNRLIHSREISEDFYGIALGLEKQKWFSQSNEISLELKSPLGFSFMLEYVF